MSYETLNPEDARARLDGERQRRHASHRDLRRRHVGAAERLGQEVERARCPHVADEAHVEQAVVQDGIGGDEEAPADGVPEADLAQEQRPVVGHFGLAAGRPAATPAACASKPIPRQLATTRSWAPPRASVHRTCPTSAARCGAVAS